MKHTYESAKKVLPAELIAEIQEYTSGVYLWIPTTRQERLLKRDWEIYYQCRIRKLPQKIIAPKFGITIRRLRQILHKLDPLEDSMPAHWKKMRDEQQPSPRKEKDRRFKKQPKITKKSEKQEPSALGNFNFDD